MLFSNKYICQVTLHKFQTNLNNFDLNQSKAIYNYFRLFWSISAYPGLSRYISWDISGCYDQLSSIIYQGSSISD